MINWATSLLQVSEDYGRRLLEMRDQATSSEGLLRELVRGYPTHGFVVSRQEARELGLPVRDARSYDLWEEASKLHRTLEAKGTNFIRLIDWSDSRAQDEDETGGDRDANGGQEPHP
jgi:hypothetical protein